MKNVQNRAGKKTSPPLLFHSRCRFKPAYSIRHWTREDPAIIIAVLSVVIGAMLAVINLHYSRSQTKKAEAHQLSAYSDYVVQTTEEIRKKNEHNHLVLWPVLSVRYIANRRK